MSRLAALLLAAFAAPLLSSCATTGARHAYPEATPFDESVDPRQALRNALSSATASNTRVLAVFGANWCHDSRALAGWLQSPGLVPLVESHYRLVYIDAGVPQTGEGRNLDLAVELGVTGIEGTPTLLVLDADGTLLNTPEDARGWRNAASRSEGDIRTWLERWSAPR